MPKNCTEEVDQRALQMAKRQVAIEDQALALVEHRRVGCVMVGAVGAADDDGADRRRLVEHGADLHRRGVGAQHRRRLVAARRQVERVVIGARGMMRRDVQRAEIVPVGFDVRPVGHGASHGAEDRRDLLHGFADRMDQAGFARTRRQRGVEAFGGQARVELGVVECCATGLDEFGQRVLELVECGTTFAALLGRGLAEVAQQCGEAAVATECGDAHGVPGAQVAGGSEGCCGFGVQSLQIVGHGFSHRNSPSPCGRRLGVGA